MCSLLCSLLNETVFAVTAISSLLDSVAALVRYMCGTGDHCFHFFQHPLTDDIWWYYMLEMGFYWSLIMSLIIDNKRKVYALYIGAGTIH